MQAKELFIYDDVKLARNELLLHPMEILIYVDACMNHQASLNNIL